MKFTITLINPNTPGDYRKANVATVNLGIAALSAYIKKYSNYVVNIIDARFKNLTSREVYGELLKNPSDVLGISMCVHESSLWISSLACMVKKEFPLTHIALGSYFPSLFPQKAFELIPKVDSIIMGEGEITFFELISNLQNGLEWKHIHGIAYIDSNIHKVITNEHRKLIQNLDILPFPERYLAIGDGSNLEVEIEGARGCAFSCVFCSVRPFYGLSTGPLLRVRSAKSILDEMLILKKKFFNLRDFRFADPDFISASCKERAYKFAQLLVNKSLNFRLQIDTRAVSIKESRTLLKLLKKAGLVSVYLGIENGNQKILDKMNKYTTVEDNIEAANILRKLGIDYTYGFMMITPWTSNEDIDDNITLLKQIGQIGLHNVFHEMTLIPGTPIFNSMSNVNRVIWKGNLHYFTYKTNSKRIEHLREIRKTLGEVYPEFVANFYFIYKGIRQLRWDGEDTVATKLEYENNRLILNVFDYCWNKAGTYLPEKLKDIEVSRLCFERFSNRVNYLIEQIDPYAPIPCPANRLPPRMSVRQV
jgi:anaerobic magnesium-protoporphyrin IX monomethyl ester cyclase